MTNMRIRGKLAVAFACLIGAFIISSGAVFVSLRTLDEASTSAQRSLRLAGQSEKLLAQILEQQNAIRGYVMTGDAVFRETYEAEKAAFDASLTNFEETTTQEEQKARARKLRAAMATWRADIGDQVLALMQDPASHEAASGLTARKTLGDLRAIQKELLDAANVRVEIRREEQEAAFVFATAALAIGALAAVGIASLMGWLLVAAIAVPVTRITETMRRLAGGDNNVEVPALGRRDEVGEMAAAVLSFKEAALEKLALEARSNRDRDLAEAERAGREREKAEEAAQDAVAIGALAQALSKLAEGDLTHRITAAISPKSERLKTDFNMAVESLSQAMGSITTSTDSVRSSSDEIAQASNDLSRRTEQQAAALEETAAALDEITATVRKTAEGAKDVSSTVAETRHAAEVSGDVVGKAVEAMTGIEASSNQVSQIVGVIDEIAFQTNLLALNAGVEAARAGDAGRGFAVVASEVRALAQRSADAAKEIKALISVSAEQVGAGVDLVSQTGDALRRILEQVASIDARVREIAGSAQEQATGLHQVNAAVNQMDQVVQQNAAMVEEATAATHALRGETESLASLVGRFRVSGGARNPVHGQQSRAAAAFARAG